MEFDKSASGEEFRQLFSLRRLGARVLEVIEACNEADPKVAMVFTGQGGFKRVILKYTAEGFMRFLRTGFVMLLMLLFTV